MDSTAVCAEFGYLLRGILWDGAWFQQGESRLRRLVHGKRMRRSAGALATGEAHSVRLPPASIIFSPLRRFRHLERCEARRPGRPGSAIPVFLKYACAAGPSVAVTSTSGRRVTIGAGVDQVQSRKAPSPTGARCRLRGVSRSAWSSHRLRPSRPPERRGNGLHRVSCRPAHSVCSRRLRLDPMIVPAMPAAEETQCSISTHPAWPPRA